MSEFSHDRRYLYEAPRQTRQEGASEPAAEAVAFQILGGDPETNRQHPDVRVMTALGASLLQNSNIPTKERNTLLGEYYQGLSEGEVAEKHREIVAATLTPSAHDKLLQRRRNLLTGKVIQGEMTTDAFDTEMRLMENEGIKDCPPDETPVQPLTPEGYLGVMTGNGRVRATIEELSRERVEQIQQGKDYAIPYTQYAVALNAETPDTPLNATVQSVRISGYADYVASVSVEMPILGHHNDENTFTPLDYDGQYNAQLFWQFQLHKSTPDTP